MYNFPPPYQNSFLRKNLKSQKPIEKDSFKNNPKNSNLYKDKNPDTNCINILGIKLYLDDLIILFIIFVLYKEKVNDNELMICLFLLLLN